MPFPGVAFEPVSFEPVSKMKKAAEFASAAGKRFGSLRGVSLRTFPSPLLGDLGGEAEVPKALPRIAGDAVGVRMGIEHRSIGAR
ncbi:MAG: hypothetical protein HKN26_13560 [Acidimicrobiales bacterium]|nr:hypothetical protein [Acidimicrobiales bacterium]